MPEGEHEQQGNGVDLSATAQPRPTEPETAEFEPRPDRWKIDDHIPQDIRAEAIRRLDAGERANDILRDMKIDRSPTIIYTWRANIRRAAERAATARRYTAKGGRKAKEPANPGQMLAVVQHDGETLPVDRPTLLRLLGKMDSIVGERDQLRIENAELREQNGQLMDAARRLGSRRDALMITVAEFAKEVDLDGER